MKCAIAESVEFANRMSRTVQAEGVECASEGVECANRRWNVLAKGVECACGRYGM